MKKKLFILTTLIISVYAMTACGKGKTEAPAAPQEAVQEAAKETEAAQEAAEETVKETVEATEPENLLGDFVGDMDLSGSWDDEVSKRASMDVTTAATISQFTGAEVPQRQRSGRSTAITTPRRACFLTTTAATRSTLLTTKETRPFPEKRRRAALS